LVFEELSKMSSSSQPSGI
jgi:hypothetical protein